MGKKYLTVQKRRSNERNVLAAKKQNIDSAIQDGQEPRSLLVYKYGSKSKQQSNEDRLSGPSSRDNGKDHNDITSSSNPSDNDSSQDYSDYSEHCEQCKNISLVPSDCDSSNAADSETEQNLSPMINLDPYSCRRSLVDLEGIKWTFSLHNTSETIITV